MTDASFTPTFDDADVDTNYGSTGGDIVVPQFKSVKPFRFWCQKTMPLTYDDSLSYYELLSKVVNYLNNMMTDLNLATGTVEEFAEQFVTNQEFLNNMARELGENTQALEDYINDRMQDFLGAYNDLQGYVNDYFNNLDVQEEINDKLDVMASDGTLDTLFQPYFENWLTEQGQAVANQNSRISVLEGRMDTFASLPSGSTSGNAELLDIRTNFLGETFDTAGDAVRVSDLVASGYISLPLIETTSGSSFREWFDVEKYKDGKIAIIINTAPNDPITYSLMRTGNITTYSESIKLNSTDLEDFNYVILRNYNDENFNFPCRMLITFTVPSDFEYKYIGVEGWNEITGEILPKCIVYGTYWDKTAVDPTLSVNGEAADAKVTGDRLSELNERLDDEIADVKSDLGEFKYSQYKKARQMVVTPSLSVNDVFYFKPLTWSGASWSQISVQGLYNGSYTTLVRATALGQEHYFAADKQYESFVISINVASVPTDFTTFEFILCNISDLDNVASYVANNHRNEFQFRGYLAENANVNTTVLAGWYLLSLSRISGTTGLPSDITRDSILTVYPGNLTLQTLQELSYPFRSYQRYLYSSNTQQSTWIRTNISANNKKMYLFGDSLTKGVLGVGGTGTSYLELAAMALGYEPVNCGIGGIGYVYSAKKLTSEVPWNTGEGRIRAQDVINHYASELVNADTVILAYGVNDWQTLGDSGTTIAEADRRATSTNIIANVKTAIETIMTAHKGARIIVVTPINTSYRGGSVASGYALNTSLDNNGDGREAMTLEKTYQAIVDACNYYGVKYIDMTHNNAIVNYLNITHVLPDGLHPSQNTYNRLAETIAHHAIG